MFKTLSNLRTPEELEAERLLEEEDDETFLTLAKDLIPYVDNALSEAASELAAILPKPGAQEVLSAGRFYCLVL